MSSLIPNRTNILPPLGETDASTPFSQAIEKEKTLQADKAQGSLLGAAVRQGSFTSAIGQVLARNIGYADGNPWNLSNWKRAPEEDASWTFDKKLEATQQRARRSDGSPYADDDSFNFLMASSSEKDWLHRLGLLKLNEDDGARIAAEGLSGTIATLGAGLVTDIPLSVMGGKAFALGAKGLGLTKAPSRLAATAGGVATNVTQGYLDSTFRGQSYDGQQMAWDMAFGLTGAFGVRRPGTVQGTAVAKAAESRALTLVDNQALSTVASQPEAPVYDMPQNPQLSSSAPNIPQVGMNDPNVIDVEARWVSDGLVVRNPVADEVVGPARQKRHIAGYLQWDNVIDGRDLVRRPFDFNAETPDMFGDAPNVPTVQAVADRLTSLQGEQLFADTAKDYGLVGKFKKQAVRLADGLDYAAYKFAEKADAAFKSQGKSLKDLDMPANATFNQTLDAETIELIKVIRESLPGLTDASLFEYAKRVWFEVNTTKQSGDSSTPEGDITVGAIWRDFTENLADADNPLITPLHKLVKETIKTREDAVEVAKADAQEIVSSKTAPEVAIDKVEQTVEQHPLGSPMAEARLDAIAEEVAQSDLPVLEKEIIQEVIEQAKREGQEVRQILLQVGKEKESDPEFVLPEDLRSAPIVINKKKVPVAFTTTVDKALALAHKEKGRKTNKFYKDAVAYLQKLYPELSEQEINAGSKWYRENVLETQAAMGEVAFKTPEAATAILGSTKKEVEKKVYAQDPSFKYKASSGAFVVPAAARQNSDTFNRQAEMRYQIKVMEQFLVDADGMSPALKTEELIFDELTHWDAEIAAGRELSSDQAKHVETLRKLNDDGYVPAEYEHYRGLSQGALKAEIKRLKDQMEYEATLAKAMSYKKPDEGKSGEVKIYTKEEIAAANIQPSKPKVDYDVPTLDNGPRGETKKRKNLSEDSDGDAFADDAVEAIQDKLDDGKVPDMDELKLDDEGLDFEFADVVEEVEQEAPKLSSFERQKQREAASEERKLSENKAKVDAYAQETRDKTGHVSIEWTAFWHSTDQRLETSTDKGLIKSFNPDSVTMKEGSWKVEAKVVPPGKKRVVSMWIDAQAIPPKHALNYSKADTLSKLGGLVNKLFGKVGQELFDSGKLKVVKSVDELPGKHPHDVKGMYDKKSGVAYIVMRNIEDAADFYSTVLHEIGVHMGMPKVFGDLWSKVLSDVDGIPELKAIKEKLRGEVPEAHLNEEAIAYYVQLNPQASFTRRIIAGIKLWAYKLAGGRFIKLGGDDMVALAVQALRKEARSYDKPFEGAYVNKFNGWDAADDGVPEGHSEEAYYSLAKLVKKGAVKAEPSVASFWGKTKSFGDKASHMGKTMGYRLSESANPFVRTFARQMLTSFDPDGVNSTNGSIAYREQNFKANNAPFMAATQNNFEAYYKELPGGFFKDKSEAYQEFNRLTMLSIQGVSLDVEIPKAIQAQVKLARETFARSLKDAKEMEARMKAFGFDTKGSTLSDWARITADETYTPRLLNHENLRRLVSVLGRDGVIAFIDKAMLRATPKADPAKTRLMADAYMRWMELNESNTGSQVITLGLSREDLAKTIKETDKEGYFNKLGKEDFEALLDTIMDTQQVIEAADTRTRARIPMAMDTFIDVDGERIYLTEMFESDLANLMNRYQQQFSGVMGRAQAAMLKPLEIADEVDKTKLPEWVIERNGRYYADQSHRGYYGWVRDMMVHSAQKDADGDHVQVMEDFEMLWRYLNGQPLVLANEGDGARLIRTLRNFTTFARAWLFALSMTAELAKQFNSRTFVAATRHFPSLLKDIVAMRKGTYSYEAATRLAEFSGIGLDNTVLPSYQRISGIVGSMESMSENARNFTLRRSGFNAVNNASRLFAVRIELEHMLRIGRGEVKASASDIRRYQAYGIPKGKLDEVAAQVARHYDRSKGEVNFEAFNADNWENAQMTRGYIYRMAKKGSSEAFVDQTQSWSHGPMADLFLQFQRSSIDGFLLHGVQEAKLKDPEAFTGFVLGWAGGAVGYTAATFLRFNQDEKELQKRLSAMEIAKNAFARAAYAGIVTKVMDLVSMGLGFQPLFSGRNSANQQAFAPASLATLGAVPGALGALTGLPFGGTTVSEAKKALSLVGGTPLLLVPGVEDFIQSSLPKQLPKADSDDVLKR